jgi:RHS repeat-associated protein
MGRLPTVVNEQRSDKSIDYVAGLALIAAVTAGDTDYLDHDGLGSTVNVSDSSGHHEESLAYDPWGASLGPFDPLGTEEISYRFAGQALDIDDGLYYMRARYYDPLVGRFLSRDALGTRLGSPYEQNIYIYARNNPVKYVDPTGLSSEGSAAGLGPTGDPRMFETSAWPTPGPTAGPTPSPSLPQPIPMPLPPPCPAPPCMALNTVGSYVTAQVGTPAYSPSITITSAGTIFVGIGTPRPLSVSATYMTVFSSLEGQPATVDQFVNGLTFDATYGEGIVGSYSYSPSMDLSATGR